MSKPTLVFVAENVWERPAKLALGLRSLGYPCLLLHIEKLPFEAKNFFDYSIQCGSPSELLEIAVRIKPDIIHLFSYGTDLTSMAIMQLIRQHIDAKVVFDYKDLFENVLSYPQDESRWMQQRYLVENADGLCCRDRQLENYLRVNSMNPSAMQIVFPDYCYDFDFEVQEKHASKDEIHVVQIGTFMPEETFPQFYSQGYYLIAQTFANQGVHFHLYPSRFVKSIFEQQGGSIYIELSKQNSFFHMHEPVPVEQLIFEISRYDFGIMLSQGNLFGIPENFALNEQSKFGSMTRMFDYLEAGLDVLVDPLYEFHTEMMNRYQFGHLIDSTFISANLLEKLLAIKNDDKNRAHMQIARKALSIARHVHRLADFYESL